MSWTETRLRWDALREVAAAADLRKDGELPWADEYAAIFGDRHGLVAALRYRWELTAGTQLDSHLAEHQLDERFRDLAARHAGVLRVLRRYDADRNPERGAGRDGDRVSA
jgi:hypothetical protein